jgi:hypothetical protein
VQKCGEIPAVRHIKLLKTALNFYITVGQEKNGVPYLHPAVGTLGYFM